MASVRAPLAMLGDPCPGCGGEAFRFLPAPSGLRVCPTCAHAAAWTEEQTRERMQALLKQPGLTAGARSRIRAWLCMADQRAEQRERERMERDGQAV